MNQELKRDIILENNANPFHKKKIDDDSFELLNANNTSCIDKFDIQIKYNNGTIEDIYFSGEGCAISTATTSIMIKLLVGKTKEKALDIINNYLDMIHEKDFEDYILEEAIVFDAISKQPNRIKCATLTWETVKEHLEKN